MEGFLRESREQVREPLKGGGATQKASDPRTAQAQKDDKGSQRVPTVAYHKAQKPVLPVLGAGGFLRVRAHWRLFTRSNRPAPEHY